MKHPLISELEACIESDDFQGITPEQAQAAFELPQAAISQLFPLANALRERHGGDFVKICGIVNAKAGQCEEKCNFCAQSAHFEDASSPEYDLMSADVIEKKAKAAWDIGVREFSIVTAGTSLEDENEVAEVAEAIRRVKSLGMEPCVSIGLASDRTIDTLKDAGLVNFHHNLETAGTFHEQIVETHSFDEELEAIRRAAAKGMSICAGGIMGMGESPAQRVELAFTLKELDVDHVPINFLNPIDGTPLEGTWDLTPLECLRIIAVYRLILPHKDVFVMGGREVQLRELQSMIFFAGANGMMMGGYLTTGGRNHETDLRMIRDLGLKIVACDGAVHPAFEPVTTENAGEAMAKGASLPSRLPVL